MTEHINGYSLALFSLAKEEKKLKQYKTQATSVVEALSEVEEYEVVLSSKSIDSDKKIKMIKQAFSKKLNKNLLNFLFILVERNKFRIAKPALLKLVKFINQEKKIHEGVVYTSVKLTPKELKDLEARVSKILSMKVNLVNKIDTEIISGFKVQVGDELIEDTIASRLAGIRNQLLRKDN